MTHDSRYHRRDHKLYMFGNNSDIAYALRLGRSLGELCPASVYFFYQKEVVDITAKSMLYIGRDPINLQLVRYLLTKKFPHVKLIQAQTSEEALSKIEEDSPNLVLVDIQLPITEEYDIPEQFKQQTEHESTPIWAVSGFAMEQDITRAYQSGFDQYFTKPLHLLSFTRHLRRELDE